VRNVYIQSISLPITQIRTMPPTHIWIHPVQCKHGPYASDCTLADDVFRGRDPASMKPCAAGSLNPVAGLHGSRIAPSEYVVSQGTVLKRMGRVYIEQDGSQIWVGGMVRICVMVS